MTIELLFAKAAQGRTFLLMLLCGGALACGVHVAGYLHRRATLWGTVADILCALGLALALCQVLLQSGEGLRLYGLLGLCIGAAMYTAGIAPMMRWISKGLSRPFNTKGNTK